MSSTGGEVRGGGGGCSVRTGGVAASNVQLLNWSRMTIRLGEQLTGMPADARHLLGRTCPSSESQLASNMVNSKLHPRSAR